MIATTASEPQPSSSQTPEAHAEPSLWPSRLSTLAGSFYDWLSRPRVRLTVIGVILLVIGGLISTSSVWTLPLVVVGAVMVVIAWIGRRLDGRFAVDWGESGTQVEFRAKIKAAQLPPLALAEASSAQSIPPGAPEPEQVIEGEAHTVEIDVAELKALIAAAEMASGEIAAVNGSAAIRILRVADVGPRSSEAVS